MSRAASIEYCPGGKLAVDISRFITKCMEISTYQERLDFVTQSIDHLSVFHPNKDGSPGGSTSGYRTFFTDPELTKAVLAITIRPRTVSLLLTGANAEEMASSVIDARAAPQAQPKARAKPKKRALDPKGASAPGPDK